MMRKMMSALVVVLAFSLTACTDDPLEGELRVSVYNRSCHDLELFFNGEDVSPILPSGSSERYNFNIKLAEQRQRGYGGYNSSYGTGPAVPATLAVAGRSIRTGQMTQVQEFRIDENQLRNGYLTVTFDQRTFGQQCP